MGCPGQNGQTSCAAMSQTVNTKFMAGAQGAANSSHDLLRIPAVLIPASSSCRSASGRGVTPGAVGSECAFSLVVQYAFSQDGARRVAGAEKQYVVLSGHPAVSSVAVPQQPGTQHEPRLDLVPRMKALRNLLPTSPAIASNTSFLRLRPRDASRLGTSGKSVLSARTLCRTARSACSDASAR
jgi:hypothetical protein